MADDVLVHHFMLKPAEQCRGQVAYIDVGLMVSGISTDEHAGHICVASHMSGPPVGIDLQTSEVHPLPSMSTGGSCCSQVCTGTLDCTLEGLLVVAASWP